MLTCSLACRIVPVVCEADTSLPMIIHLPMDDGFTKTAEFEKNNMQYRTPLLEYVYKRLC